MITSLVIHSVTCNSCALRVTKVSPQRGVAVALQHEADNPTHRVTVWDTARSQMPRDYWNR